MHSSVSFVDTVIFQGKKYQIFHHCHHFLKRKDENTKSSPSPCPVLTAPTLTPLVFSEAVMFGVPLEKRLKRAFLFELII